MKRTAAAITLSCLAHCASPAAEIWELPPILHAETAATDPIAKLAADLANGSRTLEGNTAIDRLRVVLRLLDVPESSQVLVFSKTSKQNPLISPTTPRAIYFNENAYVGFVPGGLIEIIVHDPTLGVVFYHIDPGTPIRPAVIQRDRADCLSCHGTARTESVPGTLVRSVFPDATGQPILSMGSFLINTRSPIAERWGGYYVTGHSSLPHLGNQTFTESTQRPKPALKTLPNLNGTINTQPYPQPTSDIVALMVLEHQCSLHNLLTAASMQYRRIHWLQKSLNPNADPDTGSAGQHADHAAKSIVDALLFKDEAPLGDGGIEGSPAFQDAFTARFPKSPSGHSLADFNLNDRLFKHRCSYMIHSAAFTSLPPRVKSAVLSQLHLALNPPPSTSSHLKPQERKRINEILTATLPDYAKRPSS